MLSYIKKKRKYTAPKTFRHLDFTWPRWVASGSAIAVLNSTRALLLLGPPLWPEPFMSPCIIGEDWNAAPTHVHCHFSLWNVNVDTEVQSVGQKFSRLTQLRKRLGNANPVLFRGNQSAGISTDCFECSSAGYWDPQSESICMMIHCCCRRGDSHIPMWLTDWVSVIKRPVISDTSSMAALEWGLSLKAQDGSIHMQTGVMHLLNTLFPDEGVPCAEFRSSTCLEATPNLAPPLFSSHSRMKLIIDQP